MFTTPAFFTAASISPASRTLRASGFSQRMALPARAAAMAISAWVSLAVLMSMISIVGSETTSCQCVTARSHPNCEAAASTPDRLRPQMV
jgi:hypothetical protein